MPHDWALEQTIGAFSVQWKCRKCYVHQWLHSTTKPDPNAKVGTGGRHPDMTCEEYVAFQVQGE